MTITLQSLKEFFIPTVVWEVDFRDVSIETKTVLYSIKKVGTLVLSIATTLLGLWLGFSFVKGKSLEETFAGIQTYVANNETKSTNLLKLNKSFYEDRDKVSLLINALSDNVNILTFLQNLTEKKSDTIKFSEVVIQKDKKDFKQKKISLNIRINGCVAGDIGLVESLKDDILKFPSLSQIPNCKGFFQFDQNQNGLQEEEVNFQITLQSNE